VDGIREFSFSAALDFAMNKLLIATVVLVALSLAGVEGVASTKNLLRTEDHRLLESSGSATLRTCCTKDALGGTFSAGIGRKAVDTRSASAAFGRSSEPFLNNPSDLELCFITFILHIGYVFYHVWRGEDGRLATLTRR
jgi:hypothetical protein